MSYQLVVRTVDGESVLTTSGEVPDGEHLVSGHETADEVQLSVGRRGPDGRFVAEAGHRHPKEH